MFPLKNLARKGLRANDAQMFPFYNVIMKTMPVVLDFPTITSSLDPHLSTIAFCDQ